MPRPRTTGALKYTALSLTAAIAALWVLSVHYFAVISWPDGPYAEVSGGILELGTTFHRAPSFPAPRIIGTRESASLTEWWFDSGSTRGCWLRIPLWFLLLLAIFASDAAAALHSRARWKQRSEKNCGLCGKPPDAPLVCTSCQRRVLPRRALRKWTIRLALTFSALNLAAGIASHWFMLTHRSQSGRHTVISGGALYSFPFAPLMAPRPWEIQRLDRSFELRPSIDDSFARFQYTVPLWLIALPAAAIAARVWLAQRTAATRTGTFLCKRCNYDRRGLKPDAPCPECGVKPALPTPTP